MQTIILLWCLVGPASVLAECMYCGETPTDFAGWMAGTAVGIIFGPFALLHLIYYIGMDIYEGRF